MKHYKYMTSGDSVAIFVNGKLVTVTKSHDKYKKLLRALKVGNNAKVDLMLVSILGAAVAASNGVITLNEKKELTDAETNEAIEPAIKKYVLEAEGKNLGLYKALIKLDRRLKKLPSKIKGEVGDFLVDGLYPITKDGCFIAYKCLMRSGDNLVDFHTGSFVQNVGTTPEMDRASVEQDHNVGCGAGLHVGSFSYIKKMYAGKPNAVIVALKVRPEDCVSKPIENGKIRTCRYHVLGVISDDQPYQSAYMPWITTSLTTSTVKLFGDDGFQMGKEAASYVNSIQEAYEFTAEGSSVYFAGDTPLEDQKLLVAEQPSRPEVSFKGLSGSQIMDLVNRKLRVIMTDSPKSKARIILKATKLFKDNFYVVLEDEAY